MLRYTVVPGASIRGVTMSQGVDIYYTLNINTAKKKTHLL